MRITMDLPMALLVLVVSTMAAVPALGSSCSASAPPSDLPWALVPDVLNLDACADCVKRGDTGRQGYQSLVSWRDSNTLPGALNPRNNRVVNFDTAVAKPYDCAFNVDNDGRYYPNGYVGFHGSCSGFFQANLTVNRVGTPTAWGPASNPKAPFSIVLISRPSGPGVGNTNCQGRPQQTYFTTSRNKFEADQQIVWKNREIWVFSPGVEYALRLFYGDQIPCPTLNKWQMEVLTRSSSGSAYTYYRYAEGEDPVVRQFITGKPVLVGPDQLILGVDKRNLDLGLDGDWLTGDIAVLSAYNRQLSSDEVEALAQAYSGRFNLLTQQCPIMAGFTAVANVEFSGFDLSTGCATLIGSTKAVAVSAAAAQCRIRTDCVGFTTFEHAGLLYGCGKYFLGRTPVPVAPGRAACLYRKSA